MRYLSVLATIVLLMLVAQASCPVLAKEVLPGVRSKSLWQTDHESGPRNMSGGGEATKPDQEPALDPYAHLEDVLRKPGEGEKQLQGTLIRLDCDAKGITFIIKRDNRILKMHTARFEDIKIAAFSSDAGSELTCGPRKPENEVVVCYVPSKGVRAKFNGVLKSVEFVPKEFKLKTKP